MPETLIVRLPNWLGDTVMAVPVLRALRAGFADARIVLAGPWASLLAGQGLGDILMTYPRSWTGRLRAADAARERRADIALLLPNSFEAALAARYWGARRRIGFAGGGRDWLLTDALALPTPRMHQVDEYLRLLAPLGVPAVETEPRLAAPSRESEERGTVRALLAESGAGPGRGRVIGIHLGAAFGPSKLWPAERVAELCVRLRDDGDVPVLLGTPDDQSLAEAVVSRIDVASLVGRDRPALLPALLAEVDALVCGDTGLGHLAAALGTPVVTLFGPTDPRLTAPRGRAVVVTHPTPCAPCFYRACPIDHPCMRGITAAVVRDHASTLLACAR